MNRSSTDVSDSFTSESRIDSERVLSEQNSGAHRCCYPPLVSFLPNRSESFEQRSRRGGCSAGRLALGLKTRAAVQGASEDVHLADDDRNQLCTNETT